MYKFYAVLQLNPDLFAVSITIRYSTDTFHIKGDYVLHKNKKDVKLTPTEFFYQSIHNFNYDRILHKNDSIMLFGKDILLKFGQIILSERKAISLNNLIQTIKNILNDADFTETLYNKFINGVSEYYVYANICVFVNKERLIFNNI